MTASARRSRSTCPGTRRQAAPRRRHQRHRRRHHALDTLLGGLEAATVDTGGRLSAGAVRRLACEAGLVPMVLDGASRPLDVGRLHRFHTEAQRLALAVSQKHCQHPTCTVPAWLCHVHHTTFWTRGGRTNIKDAELLCPRHHALAHRAPPTSPMRT